MKLVNSSVLIFFFMVSIINCATQKINKVIGNSSFAIILENYIDRNNAISNDCNATPFYKIYFEGSNDSLSFWVGAHLGFPSPVIPVEPETMPLRDPIEIKGYTNMNNRLVVFYDYVSSEGHGLYNPAKLKEYCDEAFEKLEEGCENILYPEAFKYRVSEDSIYLIGKREVFQLQ